MSRMWRLLVFFLIVVFYCVTCTSAPTPIGALHPETFVPPEKRCAPDDVVKIAVIDTGTGLRGAGQDNNLCNFGHRDFTFHKTYSMQSRTPVPIDNYGHGTSVAGLIDRYAKDHGVKFCMIILKFWDTDTLPSENHKAAVEAIKYAARLHVDFINLSEGGDIYDSEESEAIKEYLDMGGHVVAAAGNENHDLGVEPFYPAMSDPRVVAVGNLMQNGKRHPLSNYGDPVGAWEMGTAVVANGIWMTGTSMAAAIHTGKSVAQIKESCYNLTSEVKNGPSGNFTGN